MSENTTRTQSPRRRRPSLVWVPMMAFGPLNGLGVAWAGEALGYGRALPALAAVFVGWVSIMLLMPWASIAFGRTGLREIERLTAFVRDALRHERRLPLHAMPMDRTDEIGELAQAVQETLARSIQTRIESKTLNRAFDDEIARGIRRATSRLEVEACTDALTGLGNRRLLDRRLNELLDDDRAEPVSLIILDLDFFKPVNDILGHAVGDQCLVDVASILKAMLRHDDCAARLGGDEFVVLLPGLARESTVRIAQRIAALYARMPWPHLDAERPSMSIGVATMAGHDRAPADDLFRRADEALYASKRGGRGRVTSDRAFAGAA